MTADSNYLAALENQYGLPPGILNGVMQVESGGNLNAVSNVGAQGPFQLIPATQSDLGVTNPFDFQQSATGAAMYLSQLQQQTGSIQGALEAYNWGIGNYQNSNGNAPSSVKTYADNVLSYLTNQNPSTDTESGSSSYKNVTVAWGNNLGNYKASGNAPQNASSGNITGPSDSSNNGDGAGAGNVSGPNSSGWLNDLISFIKGSIGNVTVILAGLIILALAIWFSIDSNQITIKTK